MIDNLLQNALEKRKREPGVKILVQMMEGGRSLAVSDTGSPVPEEVVVGLFAAPVASEDGLGIGLYHAALQASESGYSLRLTANADGNVRFEMVQTAA